MESKIWKELEETVIGVVFEDPDRFRNKQHNLKRLVSDAIIMRDKIFLTLYDKAEAGEINEEDVACYKFWLLNGSRDFDRHFTHYNMNKEELQDLVKLLNKLTNSIDEHFKSISET